MGKKKKVTFEFSIDRIRTLKFFIDNTYANKIEKDHKYVVEITPEVGFFEKNKIFALKFNIKLYLDNTKENTIAEIVTEIGFKITNFSEVCIKKGEIYEILDEALYHFMNIGLSTTRGILAAKTEGTILQNSYVPDIDIKKFVEETFKNIIKK